MDSNSEQPVSLGAFSGPLFLVGMPRSGTKLLRDLLNRHDEIATPSVETHFIPQLVEEFGSVEELSDERTWSRFVKYLNASSFAWNYRQNGVPLDRVALAEVDRSSWASLFEGVLRLYLPEKKKSARVWGDKTPAYLSRLSELSQIFEQARFVHLVRDPRDQCLSAHRTWGKDLLRAAERWRRQMEESQAQSEEMSGRYIEVRYEDLLTHSREVLERICSFLDVRFNEKMLTLDRPTENYGDAKGKSRIVQDNTEKYEQYLDESTIQRIEEIAYPIMQETGYKALYAEEHRPLGKWRLRLATARDWLQVIRFHTREKGVVRGLSYIGRLRSARSWKRSLV